MKIPTENRKLKKLDKLLMKLIKETFKDVVVYGLNSYKRLFLCDR